MGQQMQTHTEPLLSALDEVRDYWSRVKSALEQDRAQLEDIRGRVRGALGIGTMLTGQQGIAFDSAVGRYLHHVRDVEDLLQELMDEQLTCSSSMRTTAEEADHRITYGFWTHAEIILEDLLPGIRVDEMVAYGDMEIYRAMSDHKAGFLARFAEMELEAVTSAYDAISGVLAGLANDLAYWGRRWNDAISSICDVLNQGLGFVDALVPFVEEAIKGTDLGTKLDAIGQHVPYIGPALDVTGILLDWGAEKAHSLYNLAKDSVGGVIAVAVTVDGVGALIVGALTLMQVGSSAMSVTERVASDVLTAPGSMLNQDLQQLSRNWATTASNLNVGKVFDEYGAVVVDVVVASSYVQPDYGYVNLRASTTWERKAVKDLRTAGVDTVRLPVGAAQFVVNAKATAVSDTAVLSNFAVQRAPLPKSFKSVYAHATSSELQQMTDVSNLITRGKLPKNQPPDGDAGVIEQTLVWLPPYL